MVRATQCTAEAQQSATRIASNRGPEHLDGYLGNRARDSRFQMVHEDGMDLKPWMEIISDY
jgi:hypothetical protein